MRTLKLPALGLLVFIAAVLCCECNPSPAIGCWVNYVFDGCCNRISLERTGQRVALTAFCPTGRKDSIEDPSYVYSRLYLDEVSQFDGKELAFLRNSSIPLDTSNNLTTACISTSFALQNSILNGTCGNDITIIYDLKGSIESLDGTLRSQYEVYSGTAYKGGAFNQTCNNINVDGKTRWLEANCSTNPYGVPNKTEEWIPSSLYLPDCLSRDTDLGNVDLTTVREDIINRTQTCLLSNNGPDPATLRFICPDGQWNKTIALPNFVWNQNGTLGCYDIWGRNSSAPGSQQSADGPHRTNETVPRVRHIIK